MRKVAEILQPFDPMRNGKDLSLVIPLWNEQENVRITTEGLIRLLSAHRIDFEVVLVNNGSCDGTETEIDKVLDIYRHVLVKVVIPTNQGFGWGVLKGLEACNGKYLGYLVGYGAGLADAIRLYKVAITEPDHAAIAARYNRQDGIYRKVLSYVYNALIRALYGINVRDVNGTPKIFPAKYMQYLNLQSKGSFFDAELLVKLAYLGCKIVEVPAKWNKRKHGRSKVTLVTIAEMLVNTIRFRLTSDFVRWKAGAK